jgi:hypothetical protein
MKTTMKQILTVTILAATTFTGLAEEKSVSEKTRDAAEAVADKTREIAIDTRDAVVGTAHKVARATRSGWAKTKAYFSEETPVYREGAYATLAGLAREIAEVKAQVPNGAPAYIRTRLLSLDEQHDHLAGYLARFTPETIKDRTSRARNEFDRCVLDLEGAIDQAQGGVDTLPKIALQ